MGGYYKCMAFLVLPLFMQAQNPVLVESFTSTEFPPAAWDTTRSDPTMAYWIRYATSGANPDSHHARVQVYNRYDTLRQGFSDLITRPLDLSTASGVETLSFWFRFSVTAPNLGPDDSLSLSISEDSMTWSRLWTIGQSGQSNVWAVVERPLASYDHYTAARFRFRFEDRPNGSLGNTNRFFWLDSVKVMSYGVGIGEGKTAKAVTQDEILSVWPIPANRTVTIRFKIQDTGYMIRHVGVISLSIFDISGRLVRCFSGDRESCIMNHGSSVIWDRTDQSGRRLPAGIYACELQVGPCREHRMIALIR